MKKVLLILSFFIAISCSKSDDDSDNKSIDTKINLPDWLNGTYKCDNALITQHPYPKTYPYSVQFKSKNDMLIKATSTSTLESLQNKIDGLISSGNLISVVESYNTVSGFTSYIIDITSKPIAPSTSNEEIIFTIINSPQAGTNKVQIEYKMFHEGGQYGGEHPYYTLQ